MPRTISHILATRQTKLCRLLDKASSRQTSPKYLTGVHHATHCSRDATTRTRTGDTSCGSSINKVIISTNKTQINTSGSCEGVIILGNRQYINTSMVAKINLPTCWWEVCKSHSGVSPKVATSPRNSFCPKCRPHKITERILHECQHLDITIS